MKDPHSLATPVVFFIFNRPATTQRVFDAMARARPRKLLVVADGPRAGHTADRANCIAARAIVERIDWPCEILKNYSEVNLGCRHRMSSGIDWAFSAVEEAIILEDDCLPNPSFFPFCETMLSRYRDDERVMHVSGDNFQQGMRRSPHSYYFSRIAHAWGWATWRRAWQKFDVHMTAWPEMRVGGIARQLFPEPNQAAFWERKMDEVHQGLLGSWAFPWVLSCWAQGGLSIVPEVNLVSNLGAGTDATHTQIDMWYMNLPTCELGEITHPSVFLPNVDADDFTMREHFSCPGADRETHACEPELRVARKATKGFQGPRKALKRFQQWTAPIRHPWREIQKTIEVAIRKALQQRQSTSPSDQGKTARLLDYLACELVRRQQQCEALQATVDQLELGQEKPAIAGTIGPIWKPDMTSSHRKAS